MCKSFVIKLVPDFRPPMGHIVPQEEVGLDARAVTNEDGAFSLETYLHGPGAMPGPYKVTVLYYSRNDNLPRKYTKEHLTPLAVDVKEPGIEGLVLTLQN